MVDDRIIVFGGMQDTYCQSKNLFCIQLTTLREFYIPRHKDFDMQLNVELTSQDSESLTE